MTESRLEELALDLARISLSEETLATMSEAEKTRAALIQMAQLSVGYRRKIARLESSLSKRDGEVVRHKSDPTPADAIFDPDGKTAHEIIWHHLWRAWRNAPLLLPVDEAGNLLGALQDGGYEVRKAT